MFLNGCHNKHTCRYYVVFVNIRNQLSSLGTMPFFLSSSSGIVAKPDQLWTKTSQAARSKEKRLFSQASICIVLRYCWAILYFCSNLWTGCLSRTGISLVQNRKILSPDLVYLNFLNSRLQGALLRCGALPGGNTIVGVTF